MKQTFDILKIILDSTTVQSMIGQKWLLSRVEREFSKRQKQKLNIHAEVQMLLFLCRYEPSTDALLPYLGCSKFNCLMYARFLHFHGRFTLQEAAMGGSSNPGLYLRLQDLNLVKKIG